MKTTPTAEQQQTYRDQGFLVVPEFLEPEELERWRRAVDLAMAKRGTQRFSFEDGEDGGDGEKSEDGKGGHCGEEGEDGKGGHRGGEGEGREPAARRGAEKSDEEARYYESVFTQRINLWQTDEGIRALVHDPEFSRFAGGLAGVDGLRLWVDQALVKPAFGSPTAFHLDVPYWSFRSPHAITIWIALDDATLENGCLYFVPGSHHAEKYDNVGIGKDLGALFRVYPEWADVAPVPAPVEAGGVVFHNGLVFHGAGANMTPRARRAMTCAYMPAGSTFNGQPNVLPPPYLRTLSVGDLLDNEAQNPLLYRRTA